MPGPEQDSKRDAQRTVRHAAGSFYDEGLRDVDLGGLDESARERALQILNGNPCLCGCGHTLASCRVKDAECARSREIAPEVVKRIREGRSDAEVEEYLRSQPILPRAVPDRSPPPPPRPVAPPAPVLDARVYEIPLDGAPVRNAPEAPVTLVEFADFQCGFCAQSEPLLAQVLRAYPREVRLVFKHFPLDAHPQARGAALAALAAQEQGRFWPMHDLMFTHRDRLDRDGLEQLAREAGLDLERFRRDLESPVLAARLQGDVRDGWAAGVTGTPMFYLNGRKLMARSAAAFRQAIEEALGRRPAAAPGAPPPQGAPALSP